jgi:hypothetical protein
VIRTHQHSRLQVVEVFPRHAQHTLQSVGGLWLENLNDAGYPLVEASGICTKPREGSSGVRSQGSESVDRARGHAELLCERIGTYQPRRGVTAQRTAHARCPIFVRVRACVLLFGQPKQLLQQGWATSVELVPMQGVSQACYTRV